MVPTTHVTEVQEAKPDGNGKSPEDISVPSCALHLDTLAVGGQVQRLAEAVLQGGSPDNERCPSLTRCYPLLPLWSAERKRHGGTLRCDSSPEEEVSFCTEELH